MMTKNTVDPAIAKAAGEELKRRRAALKLKGKEVELMASMQNLRITSTAISDIERSAPNIFTMKNYKERVNALNIFYDAYEAKPETFSTQLTQIRSGAEKCTEHPLGTKAYLPGKQGVHVMTESGWAQMCDASGTPMNVPASVLETVKADEDNNEAYRTREAKSLDAEKVKGGYAKPSCRCQQKGQDATEYALERMRLDLMDMQNLIIYRIDYHIKSIDLLLRKKRENL